MILGCGVPLGSSCGLVDYCRIGADIHLEWEHNLLRSIRNRERVSTIISLRSTLGRWHLNGRAFWNDPDVFLLRENNLKLTDTQKRTVLTVNALLGGLVFTSDFVKEYGDQQWEDFSIVLRYQEASIHSVQNDGNDQYRIAFALAGEDYWAFVNLSEESSKIYQFILKPFETKVISNKELEQDPTSER